MTNGAIYSGFKRMTLNSLYSVMPEFFEGFGVLITCLDSSSAPANAAPWKKRLRDAGIKVVEIGDAIWIEAPDVWRLFKTIHAFSGFDEIYLLKNDPPKGFRSKGHFTTDRLQFKEHPPEEILSNMRQLGAYRYASDGTGIGMNFACESERVNSKVIALSEG